MKILVINADCIKINSSANLCHIAYIKGLVDSGHEVTLINAEAGENTIDPSIQIPESVQLHTYYAVSLYEALSLKKKKRAEKQEPKPAPAVQTTTPPSPAAGGSGGIVRKIKDFVLSLYGPHGIYVPFVKKAKEFRSDEEFDYVISLSSPPASHLLACKLLKSGRVKAKEWIQIWEDPWFTCFHGLGNTKKIYNEEYRLLSEGQKICYVSPLTLRNQQKAFPEFSDKMYWQPLPHYYKNEAPVERNSDKNVYGYFGDYDPETRNLQPFYLASKDIGIEVNICGNPSNLFSSTEQIHIYPRLKLDQLKPLEDNSNVLIFLCNRIGGQIPGKIYQYSATNKVILFILDGSEEEKEVLINFFKPFNRYVFCENTVEDITKAINKIEAGELGDSVVEPLDAFDPKITIQNILEGKRD